MFILRFSCTFCRGKGLGTLKETKNQQASVTVKAEPGKEISAKGTVTSSVKKEVKTEDNRVYSSTNTCGKVKFITLKNCNVFIKNTVYGGGGGALWGK